MNQRVGWREQPGIPTPNRRRCNKCRDENDGQMAQRNTARNRRPHKVELFLDGQAPGRSDRPRQRDCKKILHEQRIVQPRRGRSDSPRMLQIVLQQTGHQDVIQQ